MKNSEVDLPVGVTVTPLTVHRDHRGCLTEVFRNEWLADFDPLQWNATVSEANVLRGVHAHRRHDDYLVVLHGRMSVGLCDIRRGSPTYRLGAIVDLDAKAPAAIRIPIGVLHGFYAPETALFVYSVNYYYDPTDELFCHWADPGLGIDWPCAAPVLNERDATAASLAEVDAQYNAHLVGAPA